MRALRECLTERSSQLIQPTILVHFIDLGCKFAQLLLSKIQRARLGNPVLKVGPHILEVADLAREGVHAIRSSTFGTSTDFRHQGLDDIATQPAFSGQLAQLRSVLAGDFFQHAPHGHAALNQLQNLFGLQLLFAVSLTKCRGNALQALHTTAKLLVLIDDGLKAAIHRV